MVGNISPLVMMIRCGALVLPHETRRDVTLIAQDGVVSEIADHAEAPNEALVIDARTRIVVPGFVDIHVHGAMGADTMDATPEALETMSAFFARHGVTSFLPTTITAPREDIDRALDNIAQVMQHGVSGAQILGAHIEGPYLNVKQCGAQFPGHIRPADPREYCEWFARGHVRLVTVAPEIEANLHMIEDARREGIALAIGHSDADYNTCMQAVARGANQATHTFNGMRGLHHREPGVAGAVLASDDLIAQLIADNIHVHPAVMKIVARAKSSQRVAVITDAMRAAGLGDGEYDLGGQTVYVRGAEARLAGGSLAGSTLTMDAAFRNIIAASGCSLNEAVTMCATTPACAIYMGERKGNLTPGKDADLVVLDTDLTVRQTIVGGRV
ncbi:MAG: N-acetylglucosamine-6-phosphate deacetylase, partial [Anaerolineae bacterium]|nr:N-acetylglucosamine-6-phosphate deacetylase [Thermoflexales bacterium]MDW8408907.1 N-acetylglucosamine-6-phosphate deacetylase [Anaerolineae bacterium]